MPYLSTFLNLWNTNIASIRLSATKMMPNLVCDFCSLVVLKYQLWLQKRSHGGEFRICNMFYFCYVKLLGVCLAGVDAGFVTAIAPAEEAVLVTTPDITALRDADRVAGLLECDGIKDIKIIVNRVRPDLVKGEDMMSALDVQEMLGLPLLGVVPEDAEVIRSTNRGVPLVLNDPSTPAGLALEQATWRLVERDAMTAVMVEEQERPKKKGGVFLFFG